jgi:hypothetical protein
MTRFIRRLAAVSAVAAFPLAAAAIETSAVSSAGCDPAVTTQCVTSSPHCDLNWSRNVWTNECKPPPAPPAWYVTRPAYAPPYAPVDVPPPPPPPPGAEHMQPRWDEGGMHWVWAGI